MTGGTIDDWVVGNIFAIMNQDSPDIDKQEEEYVGNFLQREEKREDVVGKRLRKAIKRMEGV